MAMHGERNGRWLFLPKALLLACVLLSCSLGAAETRDIDRMLRDAEVAKFSNYGEFERLMEELRKRKQSATAVQQDYVTYLMGWQFAYRGRYQEAVATLRTIASSSDLTLKFRAAATIVNVTALAKQYEQAFLQLRNLLEMLPNVTDQGAREQGLSVTAYLYNLIGEYDLALNYATILKDENWNNRGSCTGAQLELQAIYKNRTLQIPKPQFQAAIDACDQIGERFRANAVRAYMARRSMDDGHYEEAVQLLGTHYDEVVSLGSPQLKSDFEGLIAQSYKQTGDVQQAKKFALRSVDSAVKNEFTEPLVAAYRLLYVIAKEQGDIKAALEYHEKYSTMDKGYLDDATARQLAYQRVKHEVDANKLQIESLNKANQVLQLQRELSDKAIENIRLYIALLAVTLISIGLWAYKTKRSQMHFMKLSRRDGLTGIFNRPHFIELAETTLKVARKNNDPVCVVLCDLDHFKSVNDNYGHAQGDYVLQRAVAAIQAHLRASDVFARIGGEEFGILLAGCNVDDARHRVERLRVAVSESNPTDGKFKISASFGIATASSSGYELQILMTHADTALYQAKRAGRDRVAVFDGASPEARTGNSENAFEHRAIGAP
jgi:diguanylate cyclase (GGDEF)-like protein